MAASHFVSNRIVLTDANGNPVTIEFRGDRIVLNIHDEEVRRILEELILEVRAMRLGVEKEKMQ